MMYVVLAVEKADWLTIAPLRVPISVFLMVAKTVLYEKMHNRQAINANRRLVFIFVVSS